MEPRLDNTVFISYRRKDYAWALHVFKDLRQHNYQVFIDWDGIAHGKFAEAIVDNVWSHAHFVVLLTPDALERCSNPADWLRREIELAIESKRNVVPLLFNGFSFEDKLAVERLQGALAPLRDYQALSIPADPAYFDTALVRLRKMLSGPVDVQIRDASAHAKLIAQQQHAAAAKELSRREWTTRLLRVGVLPAVAAAGYLAYAYWIPDSPPPVSDITGSWVMPADGSQYVFHQTKNEYEFTGTDKDGLTHVGKGSLHGNKLQHHYATTTKNRMGDCTGEVLTGAKQISGTCTTGSEYEAETMSHSIGDYTSGGWNIWSEGYIQTKHDFTASQGTLTVYARGEPALGVWPNMNVSIGGKRIGRTQVTAKDFAPYQFLFSTDTGTKLIAVEFDNDWQVSDKEDRNLLIDKITIVDSDQQPSPFLFQRN